MHINEKRKCPHYDTSDGVCGCPEFWQSAQRPQHDESSPTLRGGSNARYDQRATKRQLSTSVESIPISGKVPQITPAPSGPPKETCFFWYHGSCRREMCDRPHEAHLTWPVSPPPGFRHFSPCILPLCPLRSYPAVVSEPQQYQQRQRTVGGQTDGALFSVVTTSGESPSEKGNKSNTETDESEIDEGTDVTLNKKQRPSLRHGIETWGSASKSGERAVQARGVKGQEAVRSSFEFDYVHLSHLPSPPSTPLVNEETLLSINHTGTMKNRCYSPTTKRRKGNRRVRLEEVGEAEIDNVTSDLRRSRNMLRSNSELPSCGMDGQHSGSDPSNLAASPSFPPEQLTQLTVTYNIHKEHVPPPFDPPTGPRSTDTPLAICFFYYHKGHCRPKNGRRCDYLHDVNTPQQTVSLPYGIENHDPLCYLPLCPIRLFRAAQVKHEQRSFLVDPQLCVKFEPSTPARNNKLPGMNMSEPSPQDSNTSIRGRSPKGMLGWPLPQLTGLVRKRDKEQQRHVDRIQSKRGADLAEAACAADNINQMQREKQRRRKNRRAKKRDPASASEGLQLLKANQASFQQEMNDHLDTSVTQQRLPFLSLHAVSAITCPVSVPKKGRKSNKNRLRGQQAGKLGFGEPTEKEGMRGVRHETAAQSKASQALLNGPSISPVLNQPSFETKQLNNRKAFDMVDSDSQGARKDVVPSCEIVEYVYSQKDLGLSSEERRAHIFAGPLTGPEVCNQWQRRKEDGKGEAWNVKGHLAAKLHAAERRHQDLTGDDGWVERRGCQRYRDTAKDRVSAKSCSHCGDAGIGAKVCVGLHTGSNLNGCQEDSLDFSKAPDGNQRLDWDTDLVRRLFGEIE